MQLMDKIKKLLALASDERGNEEECKQAMAKVHRLLSEHNLTMEAVESHALDEGDAVKVKQHAYEHDKKVQPRWHGFVWNGVAKLFYGSYFRQRRTVWIEGEGYKPVISNVIVASPENAETARLVVEFVIQQIDALAKREASGCGRSFIDSYKKGCAMRVSQRCDELIARARAGELGDETGTALVPLASMYDKAQMAINKELAGMRFSKSRATMGSREGYTAGVKAGDRVSLNRPLAGSNVKGVL